MLRIDPSETSQDGVIGSLNAAATTWCETVTQRRFVQQTWRLLMDFFPGYIDLKLAGAKVSSPFVSGSNAVLVGIRYAIVLPYPPVQSINAFVYQNANGQTTSMIVGPFTIAAVTNNLGQPVDITTSTPHGFQSGVSVTVAGNAALLALLGQSTEVITVIGPNDFTLNGVLGTGAAIAGGGTVTGYNYVQDILSNPARVSPIFGQMWPVARVVLNALQLDYTLGYAVPIAGVSMLSGTNQIILPSPPNYTFLASQVGMPISIPGAGINGGTLNTLISSVVGGNAFTTDLAVSDSGIVTDLLVAYGITQHWELIKAGIKFLVNSWFVNRLPSYDAKTRDCVKAILGPAMDLRL